MAKVFNIISFTKEGHQYTLIWDSNVVSRCKAIHQLALWAGDPELNFSWIDATMLRERIRSRKNIPDDPV